MEKAHKLISKYLWIIILILSVPAVRYLFVKGYFGVSDDLHIGWLFEMDRVIKMLQFPPRYVPDLSFGFGYPLFTFVYPLPFYIAEIFHLIGFSLVNSVKIVFGLSIPLSMYYMYKLLRVYTNEDWALAGAVLYVYTPYRALELFVRGTIGEIVAFVFFPIIIYTVVKKKPFLLALSFAGLVLSHNIMAYMFMPFLLLFIVLHKSFWISLKGIWLGLLMSSYFWIPAIIENRLMKYDTVFNFYDHFPALKQFITPYWGYGASVPGNYDTMSFYMGLVGLFVMLIGTLLFVVKVKDFSTNEKIFLSWSIFVIVVSIFMMNFRSAFLWRSIPLLPYFQFPWRFLAMVTLMSPFLLIVFLKFPKLKLFPYFIIIASIYLNFNYFKTSEYLGRMDNYFINRYIPYPTASSEYLKTSEEYLRLPKESEKRPEKNYPRAYTINESVVVEVEEINSLDAKIKTSSDIDFVLSYAKYNYPGWKALVDGRNVEIISGKPYGQISFLVPSGSHTVEVKYGESTLRIIFNFVSLVSVFGIVYVLIKQRYIKK